MKIGEAKWYDGTYSYPQFQQPSRQYLQLQVLAVGRTVVLDDEVWEVVSRREVGGQVEVRIKHLSGKQGRPKLCWMPGNTPVEE